MTDTRSGHFKFEKRKKKKKERKHSFKIAHKSMQSASTSVLTNPSLHS